MKGKKREPFSPKASNNIPCTNWYIISAIDCHLFGTNVLFIKVTKTKTVAAYGQLIDVLFGTGQFPISVKETRLPEGIAKEAHIELNQSPVNIEGPQLENAIDVSQVEVASNPFDVGFEGDGNVLKPGATLTSGDSFLSSLEERIKTC